jgi:hypothetical protein
MVTLVGSSIAKSSATTSSGSRAMCRRRASSSTSRRCTALRSGFVEGDLLAVDRHRVGLVHAEAPVAVLREARGDRGDALAEIDA